MRIGNGTVVGMALLLVAVAARAEDFDDEPFSLRFPSALSRFSRYPDVAGVAGASTGAIWGSSPNPAATGWLTCRSFPRKRTHLALAISLMGPVEEPMPKAWARSAEEEEPSWAVVATWGERMTTRANFWRR